jgi:hypothetical protein
VDEATLAYIAGFNSRPRPWSVGRKEEGNMDTQTVKHGAEQYLGVITEYGREVEYVTPDGQTALRTPLCSSTGPQWKKYCAKCGEWKHLKGMMGTVLRVMCCPDCHTDWDAND